MNIVDKPDSQKLNQARLGSDGNVFIDDGEKDHPSPIEKSIAKVDFGEKNYNENVFLEDKYEEQHMIAKVMDKKTAQLNGYVRCVEYSSIKEFMEKNSAIVTFSTGELKSDKPGLFSKKTVLISNFAFLLRIILYHLILITLSNNPHLQIFLFALVELSYCYLIIKNFMALRYLVSPHLFIHKIVLSSFLLTFHIISMIILLQNGPRSKKDPSLML